MLRMNADEIGNGKHKRWGDDMRKAAASLEKYSQAMDAIYNHNAAARAAVVQHFGTAHAVSLHA